MGLRMRSYVLAALLLLAACHRQDEENIQERAQNTSARLEQRYNELQAEAESDVNSQVAPLDAETANFLNQTNGAAPANGAVANAQ
jgi:hypothetical protein